MLPRKEQLSAACTPAAQHAVGLASPHVHPNPEVHYTACCSDKANLLTETLEKQFELVKLRTSNNGTYQQGSHAKQYGTLSIDEEPVADYLGALNTGGGVGNVLWRSSVYMCIGHNRPLETAAFAGRRSCCLQGLAAGVQPAACMSMIQETETSGLSAATAPPKSSINLC